MQTQTTQRKIAILLATEAMAWAVLDSMRRKPGETLKRIQRAHSISDEQLSDLRAQDFDNLRP